MPAKDLLAKILLHLTEISRGELSLTPEQAIEPADEDVQRILFGLVYLHEELQHREAATTARAAAEASNTAKSAFLTTMSHELRTPLNAILGYGELVREQVEEMGQDGQLDTVLSDLRRMEFAAKHLLSLVNDVLDLARVEAGQLVSTVEEMDLASLVETTRRTLEPLARAKCLGLRAQAPAVTVRSDERLLLQCLLNLGVNAVKFTDSGFVAIRGRVTETGFDLRVRDTGRGMTQAQTERAFEAFEQVHGNEESGTGLGLSITQRIVRHLGGTVDVRSEPGVGTAILLRMPNIGTSGR